jgi:peptidoglycan/LPS O-acetylase OafA/YrhL
MAGRRDIPALTGLRLIAALSVVLAHSVGLLPEVQRQTSLHDWIGTGAGFGMTLFFVLSGFVIHYNYRDLAGQGTASTIGEFLWARFSRLYPMFFVIVLIDVLLGKPAFDFISGQVGAFDVVQHALPYYLTLTHSWIYSHDDTFSLIYELGKNSSVTWSISTEWFFYFAFPFIAFVVIRLRRIPPIFGWLLTVCVLWITIVSVLSLSQGRLDAWAADHYGRPATVAAGWQDSFLRWLLLFSPYIRIGEFLLGCLTAQLYLVLDGYRHQSREFLIGRIALAVSIVSIVLLTYFMYSPGWSSFFLRLNMNFGLAPSIAVLIFCVARYDTGVSRLLSCRPLVILGNASYSIYLLHILLLSLAYGYGVRVSAEAGSNGAVAFVATVRLALIVGLILVFSLGTYTFIEVPARRYLRAWFKSALPRWRGVAVAAAGTPAILAVLVLAVQPGSRRETSVEAGIRVVSATYGQNCGAPAGNASSFLKRACDGRDSCRYVVNVAVLGDPAGGCSKSFATEFECAPDRTRYRQEIPAEAGLGGLLVLTCPTLDGTIKGASFAPPVRGTRNVVVDSPPAESFPLGHR